jgi:hypothetical protein
MISSLFRGVAYVSLLLAALLPVVLLLWLYRMVAIAGSVSRVLTVFVLGWEAAAFVATMVVGSAILAMLGANLLNHTPRDED